MYAHVHSCTDGERTHRSVLQHSLTLHQLQIGMIIKFILQQLRLNPQTSAQKMAGSQGKKSLKKKIKNHFNLHHVEQVMFCIPLIGQIPIQIFIKIE